MPEGIEKSLLELDFAGLTRRKFTPSPAAWEDQVLYFLLIDRFSDGNEVGGHRDNDGHPVKTGKTPLYTADDPGRVDYDTWLKAGGTYAADRYPVRDPNTGGDLHNDPRWDGKLYTGARL